MFVVGITQPLKRKRTGRGQVREKEPQKEDSRLLLNLQRMRNICIAFAWQGSGEATWVASVRSC